MQLQYAGGFAEAARHVADLESAGLDIVWVAEAYGFDGPSFMGYLAAKTKTVQIGSGILNIYTRTPTLLAMTAAGVDALSEGRCILGLGASGPQVIEGFHGVPYDRPLGRTREIVQVCRTVWRREVLEHAGPNYTMPLPAEQGTGLGKALKLITHPVRADIPIYVASLGNKNVQLTAEIADGWLPIFYIPERAASVWGDALAAGAAARDPQLGALEISAGGIVAVVDDPAEAKAVRDFARPLIALYVGGMGAKGKNFYNELACRYGYEAEASQIQELYLSGDKRGAAALVPDEMLELTNLVGPEGYIRDRIAAFKESGVTVLQVTPVGPDTVALMEKVRTWVDA